MIVGIGVIVSLVAFIEWLRSSILDKINLSNDVKALIVAGFFFALSVRRCNLFCNICAAFASFTNNRRVELKKGLVKV